MAESLAKHVPKTCEWCGRLIVMVDSSGIPRAYEIMRDEENRLLQAYDGNLIHAGEHLCKARCSNCAVGVVIEDGGVYERPADLRDLEVRKLHKCVGRIT